MSDDLLERATRALREESAPSLDDLAETRARLLASSTTKKARRTSALRWVLPMAAAFAAGTAFAATNGQLERAVHAVQTWFQAPQTEAPKPKPRRIVEKPVAEEQQQPSVAPPVVEPPTTTEQAASPVVEAPRGVEQAAPRASSERPATKPERGVAAGGSARERAREGRDSTREQEQTGDAVAESQAASDAQPLPRPSESPDLALYREAHRAHFVAHDYADALTLWNGYLARFPAGIFVLEARYNRAICLVRLGRKDEASLALRPFAEGQVKGAYRRDEARALLDALNKKP